MKVTSNDFVWPRLSVKDDGDTVTVNPGIDTVGVYVAAELPTFVTRRLTVCVPAMSPIAIDGVFRLLGSVEKPALTSAVHVAGPTPVVVPHRNASQSLKFES